MLDLIILLIITFIIIKQIIIFTFTIRKLTDILKYDEN
jgi:hypothetical protein